MDGSLAPRLHFPVATPPAAVETLARSSRGLVDLARDRRIGEPDNLLLVVDQFEELFTQCTEEGERRAFIVALHAAGCGGIKPCEDRVGPERRQRGRQIERGKCLREFGLRDDAGPPAVDAVEIGSEVKVGQILCIIEAMKMMNQIESDKEGRVTAMLAKNGEPVEFGQPLFIIE